MRLAGADGDIAPRSAARVASGCVLPDRTTRADSSTAWLMRPARPDWEYKAEADMNVT